MEGFLRGFEQQQCSGIVNWVTSAWSPVPACFGQGGCCSEDTLLQLQRVQTHRSDHLRHAPLQRFEAEPAET